MGLAIERMQFQEAHYAAFAQRLDECLLALKGLLGEPGFGAGASSLGAELELSVVDREGVALPLNEALLARASDPHLQLELDRFNLEYNLEPSPLAGRPFSNLEAQLSAALARLGAVASERDGRVVPVGILPTLREQDLECGALTDLPRYHALAAALRKLRGAPFHVQINGLEGLDTSCDAITLEGANTSFQIHLRVAPSEFAASYNAAQLVTPLAVAIGANSPLFLERLLWDETRIALFKQAIDARSPDRTEWRRAARVPFGHGWVRNGAYELFAESVALFAPLLPIVDGEEPLQALRAGHLPALRELRLHQGTIWQWNRAIYDPTAGGHLRIELRALPGGPTPLDMAANAAFLVGLILGLRDRIDELLPGLPFHMAEYNFYRAAQRGLDAELLWPGATPSPQRRPIVALIEEMLPVAQAGLETGGVDADEARHMLDVIAQRVATGMTGARWQRRLVQQLDASHTRTHALRLMLDRYLDALASGLPVGEWTL